MNDSNIDSIHNSSKSTTLFALLALLLSASIFKDELKSLKIGIIPGSLYEVFIISILTFSTILVLYLSIDLRPGTILENRFVRLSFYTQKVLDNFLLFLIMIVIALIVTIVLINLLRFNITWQIILYGSIVATFALTIYTGLNDRKKYNDKLKQLSADERELVMKIDSLSDPTIMIYAAMSPEGSRIINKNRKELEALKEQLAKIQTKK